MGKLLKTWEAALDLEGCASARRASKSAGAPFLASNTFWHTVNSACTTQRERVPFSTRVPSVRAASSSSCVLRMR